MLRPGIGGELFLELAHLGPEDVLAVLEHALHALVDFLLQRAVLRLEVGEFHQAADFRCSARRSRHSPTGVTPLARNLPLSRTEYAGRGALAPYSAVLTDVPSARR